MNLSLVSHGPNFEYLIVMLGTVFSCFFKRFVKCQIFLGLNLAQSFEMANKRAGGAQHLLMGRLILKWHISDLLDEVFAERKRYHQNRAS